MEVEKVSDLNPVLIPVERIQYSIHKQNLLAEYYIHNSGRRFLVYDSGKYRVYGVSDEAPYGCESRFLASFVNKSLICW